MKVLCLAAVAAAAMTQCAFAEVTASSPTAFTARSEVTVAGDAERAWKALTAIEKWWSPAHTFSGEARNLSLDAKAGGCFCERWDGQSVQHATVAAVMALGGEKTLRMIGGLGPLQAMGVVGVLTFTVKPMQGGAAVSLEYRVSGDVSAQLGALAPGVDAVLVEQLSHFEHYANAAAESKKGAR